MSVNTAHANHGVLIHAGESIILFSDNVTIDFSGNEDQLFKGTKLGKIYLTTHRIIFNSKTSADPMQSFSFPFICLSDVEVEQPMFSANFIKGKVRAQENGHFTGEAKFKIIFKAGGAIDFAQAALKAAYIAKKYGPVGPPPPYTPPSGSWYEAPPPAYAPNPNGYYGWMPSTNAFPNGPPPNTVFMTDNPPPYPGIVPGSTPNGYPGGPPAYGSGYAQPPNYPPSTTANGAGGYPTWGNPDFRDQGPAGPGAYGGYPAAAGGYPPTSGYPPASGYPPSSGYPPTSGGYPPASGGYPPSSGGYPPQSSSAYPSPPGYPPTSNVGPYPTSPPTIASGPGYPNLPGQGAMGFSGGRPPASKEQEAAQSAYYDPNQPQTAYVPPPAYYEPPPNYDSLSNKKQQ